MGNMSRRKGLRVEYLLRDHLKNLGYDAIRVPSTDPYRKTGPRPDVIASKDGIQYTFEIKARKELFRSIYKWYYKLKTEPFVFRFAFSDSAATVAIGTDFNEVKKGGTPIFPYLEEPDGLKVMTKLLKYRDEWLGTSQFLVLKDNNQPLLFVRYWF